MEEKVDQLPYVKDCNGVIFAHGVSRHTATKYSPFFLLYNRHPILPIDITYYLVELQEVDDKPYDIDIFFQRVFNSVLSMIFPFVLKITDGLTPSTQMGTLERTVSPDLCAKEMKHEGVSFLETLKAWIHAL